MQIHFGVELLTPEWERSIACIGTFDGVHLGHQEVIRAAVAKARERSLPCILLTFDRHPAAILAPERCPGAIASLQTNLQHFEELGVTLTVVMRFDRELSQTPAEAFFQSVILQKLKASALVIGHDFAFGKGREGTPEWLSSRIETDVIPPFQIEGTRVSSSAIRSAVERGDLKEAAKLLGRAFEIPGIVVEGQRLGRQLGYPTANLARSFAQVTPCEGVYAGACRTPHGRFKAAVSVGLRPTIGDDKHTIEAYLLEYPGSDLYGQHVLLELHERLRGQERFDDLDALKEQMHRDIVAVEHVI